MTTPTDDAALLRVLARACGWEVKDCRDGTAALVHEGIVLRYEVSEREAWAVLRLNAPDWLHSVDAALALPWPINENDTPNYNEGYYELHIRSAALSTDVILDFHSINERSEIDVKTIAVSYVLSRDKLARALCEVFAAWFEAQEMNHVSRNADGM